MRERSFLFIMAALLLVPVMFMPLAQCSTVAHLYVSPALIDDPHLGIGDSFTLDILLANTSDLTVCQFNLTYKPTMLSCKGVWIKALDHAPNPKWEVNDYAGYVWLNVTYSIPITTAPPETIATLIFYVQGKGSTPLEFVSSELLDSNGLPISHETTGGFFKNFNRYDVNQDGIVDIIDAGIVALAFGSDPSKPNWNPKADVNSNGFVDIFDIVLITIHFGET